MSRSSTLQATDPTPVISSSSDLQRLLTEYLGAQIAAFATTIQAVRQSRNAIAEIAQKYKPSPMAKDYFLHQLKLMQVHYLAGPGALTARVMRTTSSLSVVPESSAKHLYDLPREAMPRPQLWLVPSAKNPKTPSQNPLVPGGHAPSVRFALAGEKAVDDIVEAIHIESLILIRQHAGEFVAAAQEIERFPETAREFSRKMQAVRDRSRSNAHQQFDRLFTQAAKLGETFPDQRSRLLQSVNLGSHLLNTVFASSHTISESIERNVAECAKSSRSPLTDTIRTMAGWASGAVRLTGIFLEDAL